MDARQPPPGATPPPSRSSADPGGERAPRPRGRYCVIIPAYKAARTIGAVVGEVKRRGLPVVVVDDGSPDATASTAAQHGAVVISHLRNEGKGSALRTGFEYALREHYDGVVTIDSDGQHDPAEILSLIEAGERQHAGIVVGNRMMDRTAMPPARRWTNATMSWIISAVAHQLIPDTQCGFRMIRREVLQAVPLRTRRFEIETELLLGASVRRWKIVSVPVRSIYEDHASHIRPVRDGVRFVGLVMRYLMRSSRRSL